MVFGRGRMRRSTMWCIDRYVFAMSLVRDMQGKGIEGREDGVTMWNEWRHDQTAAAVNKATKEGLGLRATMLETHCVRETHLTLRKGLGVSAELFTRLAGKRASSLRAWLDYQGVRHSTEASCTCPKYLHHTVCKHVCALRILNEDPITPERVTDSGTPARPEKSTRAGHCLVELEINETKRRKKA